MARNLVASLVAVGVTALGTLGTLGSAQAADPVCSVWLVESSRFMNVPFGSFMPDRAFVPGSTNPMNNIETVDLPVNVGVIKCGDELMLYDTGWKQQDYLKMTGVGPLGAACRTARRRSASMRPRSPRS